MWSAPSNNPEVDVFTKSNFQTAFAVVLILIGARWVINAVPALRALRGVI